MPNQSKPQWVAGLDAWGLARRRTTVAVVAVAVLQMVHDAIYNELCQRVICEESRAAFKTVIARLADEGAESVILGCTEIGLLISQADSSLLVHDSTKVHAVAAVEFALA